MASGNNTSSGIYGGFSYLNSPTDKNNPPRSPRLSSKSDHRHNSNSTGSPREEEEDLQPFSYLAPNSPLDRAPSPLPVFDQRDSFDNNKRLPRDRDGNTLPTQNRQNSNRLGSDPAYYTSAREFGSKNSGDNDRVIGELYSNRLIDEKDKKSAYIVPDYPNSIQNPGYELSPTDPSKGSKTGFIPRARVDGSSSSSGVYNTNQQSDRNNDYYTNYQPGYEGGGPLNTMNNDKNRPVSRDSYLDKSHKKNKGGCSCCVVCLVIVLVILALGGGFAVGWFTSQAVNGETSSNVTTTTVAASIVPSLPQAPVTTTTQAPVPPGTTATSSTTSNSPTTTTTTTSTTTTTTPQPTTQQSSNSTSIP